MNTPQISITKKHLQIAAAIILALSVGALVFAGYPWLQLQVATRLYNSGNYEQAEQVLTRLSNSKPEWTEPRHKLVLVQLQLGKTQQAALTVISLADSSRLGPTRLAIVYMDVANQLTNTGNASGALDLTIKVLAERENEMLQQAALEVAFRIAEHNELPLALDALNVALELTGDNWVLNRKAFNILMSRALSAPDHLAEPALDRALEIYPNDVVAFTRKVKIMADRAGSRHALDWLVDREALLDPEDLSVEYYRTKRDLILRLALSDTEASLAPYIAGINDVMLKELALQGMANALARNRSGRRFYDIASYIPEIAFTYGRNLFQNGSYLEATQVFDKLRMVSPDFTNIAAITAALHSKTQSQLSMVVVAGDSVDAVSLSPDGSWLAMRRWMAPPWSEESISSNLLIRNLSTGLDIRLGDAMFFSWAASENLLAYLRVAPTGLGSLTVVNTEGTKLFELPPEYSILDFSWADTTLLIQAEDINTGGMKLLQVRGPLWKAEEPIDWEISGPLNQNFTWVSPGEESLLIYRYQQVARQIHLEREVAGYTHWSPNGRYVVVESMGQQHWLFDHNAMQVHDIPTPGYFAGWASNSQPFWFYPLWDGLYVLARLNIQGNVVEFLPFTFANPYLELSVAGNGTMIVWVEDGKPWISRR